MSSFVTEGAQPAETTTLIDEIKALLHAAREAAARQVNTLLVLTNYEIGRRIVEHEQGGEARAVYGDAVLDTVSAALTEEFGRGYSRANVALFRKFFLAYRERAEIVQTASGRFTLESRAPAPAALGRRRVQARIRCTPSP